MDNRELIKKVFKSGTPVLLKGAPGTWKTYLLEKASKEVGWKFYYILCHQWMTEEDFLVKFDPSTWKRVDGLLPTVAKQSRRGKVAVLVDELDKTRTAIDNLFLDFLQNWRIRDSKWKIIEAKRENILIGFTSNDIRPISEALLRRLSVFNLSWLSKKVEVEIISNKYRIDKNISWFLLKFLEVVRRYSSNEKWDLNSLILLMNSILLCENKGEVKTLIYETLFHKFEISVPEKIIKNLTGIFNMVRKKIHRK